MPPKKFRFGGIWALRIAGGTAYVEIVFSPAYSYTTLSRHKDEIYLAFASQLQTSFQPIMTYQTASGLGGGTPKAL